MSAMIMGGYIEAEARLRAYEHRVLLHQRFMRKQYLRERYGDDEGDE